MKAKAATRRVSPLMGTERVFFEENRARLCAGYAAQVQKLVDDWEADATAVGDLRRKRFRKVRIATFFGTITLRAREGIGPQGRWSCPALAFLGLRPNQRSSPDLEKRWAVLVAETGSYEKAGAVADATWLAASDDALRALTVRLGEIAAADPPTEMAAGAAAAEDTLVVMADGWNARHRGPNWGRNQKNRKLPERVHWFEIRSAVIFKLSALLAVSGKRKAIMDKHVVAVPAETSPYDFGLLLQREMARMGARRAKNVFFVMDGGVWLWNLFADRFERCARATLGFYHLSQHLHALADMLHGPDTAKAKAWCGRILHGLKHRSAAGLFRTLDELLREPPSDAPEVREAIRAQNAYFRKHQAHMEYAALADWGVPIGSGSVESLCSQFQMRLKRTGQFWTQTGLAALLRILVRYWNHELDGLWLVPAA